VRLGNIQQACSRAIEGERFAKVGFNSLDEFLSKLRTWAESDPEAGKREKAKPQKQDIQLLAATLTEAERRTL
jgi:hypothetical protein